MASEFFHPSRAPDLVSSLPFLQEDLYNTSQPGEARTRLSCCSCMSRASLSVLLLSLQLCSWWTTSTRCTCGRAGGRRTASAPARPASAGTQTGSVPWRRCCSTAEVSASRDRLRGCCQVLDQSWREGSGTNWITGRQIFRIFRTRFSGFQIQDFIYYMSSHTQS